MRQKLTSGTSAEFRRTWIKGRRRASPAPLHSRRACGPRGRPGAAERVWATALCRILALPNASAQSPELWPCWWIGARSAERRQSRPERADCAAIRRQHPSSLRARRGRSLPWWVELTFRAPTRHRAPDQQPGRILLPGDGAAGEQEAQNRPACPGNGGYATPAARPVSTTSWRHGLRRTCRLVIGRSHRPRSTWPDQARLPLLTVTHRYKRTHCLWLEQFHIAEYLLRLGSLVLARDEYRSSIRAALRAPSRYEPATTH